MKWSIRSKFLFVMSGLLTVCLGVYLFMAVTVFKSDKTQLVFDLNRSQVSNLTSELETQFSGVSEKLKVFALLPSHLQNKMADDLLSDNSDVVAISIFPTNKKGLQAERTFHQERFLETYGLRSNFFSELSEENAVPLEHIMREGEDIWNASIQDGPPLIGYGRLVVVQDHKGVPIEQWAVVGFVKLDRFLKSVSIVRLSEIFVSNRRGEILVQPNALALSQKPRVSEDPLFLEALEAKARISVVNREAEGQRVLAAYAKGLHDRIYVVAKTSESQVFKVVRDLTVRTLLFGTLVLTLVILAAFLVSRSLTENIALLADRMESASKGDLSTRIQLRGHDETITLAKTFNQMIDDLKESRDALETMNRELDQKVKERTAQLEEQNRKVKEIQEALIRTTRLASVGEIAGRAAHEVLNPLTILLTRVGLMQKRSVEEQKTHFSLLEEIRNAWKKDYEDGGFDQLTTNWKAESKVLPGKNLFQEDLENIERTTIELQNFDKNIREDIQFVKIEGERIGKIINNMRRLGHSKSDVRAHSIHSVLTDCCQIMKDLFDQQGFVVKQEFQADRETCRVDRDELIQSITNLMRNSLQALQDVKESNPNAQDLGITLRTVNNEGDIHIEIEDNGVGISPDNQSRLFESSFTTRTPEHGTGLGLGIARRFVRGHGGDIEFVSSKPGEKTVFRVRIPVSTDEVKGAVA